MPKEISEVKGFRLEIGYSLLMLMERVNDLPLPNVDILAKTMQDHFNREGIVDDIKEAGYRWVPDSEYWKNHIRDISEYMSREYKIYFGFLRNEGLKGIWKFMNKGEYEKCLIWSNQDISTRIDTQNDKIELGESRWKIDIPRIAEVARLT